MPTPKNPADFRDMDDPVNIEADPEDVLKALLSLQPDGEDESDS